MADEADSGAFPDPATVVAALEGGFDNYEAPDDSSYEEEVVDHADDVEQDEQTPDLGETPDLSDLDPASRALVEARIRDFQRGFTEKTTKLSDANRILQAAGGDPEAVLEAYQFQQQLLDDGPEGDAARARLYQALSAQYAQATPETQETPEAEDPFSDYDLPPEIRDRLNMVQQLDARLREFEQGAEQYAAEQAAQEYRAEVEADLEGKWQEIKGEFPDLEGESPQEAMEIEEEIMAFGAFTGGNLMKAVDLYHRHEARLLARLTQGSVSVPGGSVSPPAGGGHSTEPVEYDDFKTAGKGAQEFLEQAFQNLG